MIDAPDNFTTFGDLYVQACPDIPEELAIITQASVFVNLEEKISSDQGPSPRII